MGSFIPKDERVPKSKFESKNIIRSSFIPKDERVPKSAAIVELVRRVPLYQKMREYQNLNTSLCPAITFLYTKR